MVAVPGRLERRAPNAFVFCVSRLLAFMETDKKSPGEGKLIHPSRFQRLQLRASPVTSLLITFYFSNLPIGVSPRSLWFTLIRAGLQAETGICGVRGMGRGRGVKGCVGQWLWLCLQRYPRA